jgi:hypothetical protein
MRENLKVFGDRIPFVVYPSCNPFATHLQPNCNLNNYNLVVQASLNLVRPGPKLISYLA